MNATHVSCPMAFDTTKYFVIPVSSVILAAWLLLNCLALFALLFHIKKCIVLSVYVLNKVLADLLEILVLLFWISYNYHKHH